MCWAWNDGNGCRCTRYAIEQEQEWKRAKSQVFPMLVPAGADLNAQTTEGETPLMTAVLHKYPMMLHLLLKEGASVNCKFREEVAPLYCRSAFELALAVNSPETAILLFNAGAEVSVLDHLELAEEFHTLERKYEEQEEEVEELYDEEEMYYYLIQKEREIQSEKYLKQLMRQLKSERPRSLKILCRKTIRTSLGQRIQKNIHKTGLPDPLIDYVLMKADLKEPETFISG